MSVYLVIAGVLGLTAAVMVVLSLLPKTAAAQRHKARADKQRNVPEPEYRRHLVINSVISMALVFGCAYLLHDHLFVPEVRSAPRMALEAGAILLLYDLLYYLMHRYAFHAWSLGRRVHAVHHRIRTPYAIDSLFIHPAETLAGVGLLMSCTLIIGPVSVYSFGLCFFVYSVWNVFIHSAFHFPFFPFKSMTRMVEHHDIHHASMKGGYFASITPIFDLLFRTAR